ncbi:hypothetical protein QF035_008859 [Streptomyces umbrinus]|uniref:Uncharacterized protein n=1 Tax=Streptomyces umbrinus TaxID=67370 RepID=A0ABU0T649_9ACTN|nr:hypothetical protein [Streptomyces umbrinus]MDQ1031277.1 hypothetical protein [Streptomyces umbrinus]
MHRRDTHIDPGKQHILDRSSPHTRAIPTRNVPAVVRRPGDARNRGLNQIRDRRHLDADAYREFCWGAGLERTDTGYGLLQTFDDDTWEEVIAVVEDVE